MRKELAPLLARTAIDEVETQHDAVGRLVKVFAEAMDGSPAQDVVDDSRTALYGLLASPRLAVVSKACHGLTQLLTSHARAVDLTEASNHLIKALEIALAREQEQEQELQQLKQEHRRGSGQQGGVTHVLTRCLVAACREQARRQSREGGRLGVATLLSMNRGLLYPALSHESASFLSGDGVQPREVVAVVAPLASAILLQPEYANLRGGFLLKLSTASAQASDAVKLCLIVLQAEVLGFCAVHTAAHADVAAGWCASLANAALSVESDASWGRASRAVAGATISLCTEFRERGLSITPLLPTLQSISVADPLCLVDEVAFLGITALQSPCVDDREALLRIVGRTVRAMPRHREQESATTTTPGGIADGVSLGADAWSLETLVYPIVSMAAAGNVAAGEVLQPLEAALVDVSTLAANGGAVGAGPTQRPNNDTNPNAERASLRYASAVMLGVRRLSALGGDERAMLSACAGLRQRAGVVERAAQDNAGCDGGRRAGGATSTAAEELERAFCLVSPLLLRPHGVRTHGAACEALVAAVRAVPTLGVRLLSFVLYAIRRLGGVTPEGGCVLSMLEILPELGAHKVTAKPVAGVIQTLAKTPQAEVRGVGIRLAARLIQVNSRSYSQLQPLIAEVPADHKPPSPPEPDESRLCRAAGMLDVCTTDPERGLECVRPLQAFLADPLPSVTALALRAIAALCRGDCLDFDASLRIVSKKGKVAHLGRRGSPGEGSSIDGDEWGDPRVVASLAELCGAGAEAAVIAAAAAAAEEDEASDVSDDDIGAGWGMGKAVETLLGRNLRCHPNEAVRTAVYTALAAHLPALLRAETSQDMEEEDAVALAPRVRRFLAEAMASERDSKARPSLATAASIVLAAEGVDPSTWAPSKRAGAGRGGGGSGGGKGEDGRAGPSNRLLAALPHPDSVLQAFRRDVSSCPGLAGAVLWSYPAGKTSAAVAHRDAMIRDLGELMAAEGTGGGLTACPWQQAAAPLGVQRYVTRLFAACLAAAVASQAVGGAAGDGGGGGGGGADIALVAVENCRKAIEGLRGVPRGLTALASASLASCVPRSLAHVVVEEIEHAADRLRNISCARALLDGEELFPLCMAMVARALPETAAESMTNAAQAIEDLFRRMTGVGALAPGGAAAAGDTLAQNESLAFWSCVSVGVASEWACRHPAAPEAREVVSRAVGALLAGMADAVGSDHVRTIAEAWFGGRVGGAAMDAGSDTRCAEVLEWGGIDVGDAVGEGAVEVGLPTTARGSKQLALFLGLSSTLPGLRATGMHRELVQVFNIIRAFQEAGVCGAALCLTTAASECLSCGLIDSPAVLGCLRSLSVALDGATTAASGAATGRQRMPAQDACLGAAGLVVACAGKVMLPPGFAESMFGSLRKAAAHRRGADSGLRVASLLALGSMVGCPLLGRGEFAPRRIHVSSTVTRRMVEALLQDVQAAMDGTSLRPKNAAARVWGCLCAAGQDEHSAGDPVLQDALGWTKSGGTLGADGADVGGGLAEAVGADALRVAREGTLMNEVLTGLQEVASGMQGGDGQAMETDAEKKLQMPAVAAAAALVIAPECSALFAESALACLEPCPTLRVPHPQMAAVIQALFRGGHGAAVESRCVSLALALADKDRAYSTWLRGLFGEVFFGNLSAGTRRHLVSMFDRVALKVPSKTAGSLIEEVWGGLTWTLFSHASRGLETAVQERTAVVGGRGSGGVALDYGEGIFQTAMFLSRLEILVATAKASGRSGDRTSAMTAVVESVAAVTTATVLPSVLRALEARDCADGAETIAASSSGCREHRRLFFLETAAPEAPLLESLVGLLSCLPRQRVADAIAFKSGAAAVTEPATNSADASRQVVRQAIRAYLISRLARKGTETAEKMESSSQAPSDIRLGSVARWATRARTDRTASAVVLPRLSAGLGDMDDGASRARWFRTLLDTAGLPESCPMRAASLVAGAAAAWEPSNTAFLVTGEEASDDLLGQGVYRSTRLLPGKFYCNRGAGGGALLYVLGVAAPKAVATLEKSSPEVSAEVLSRLFRLSGSLRGRRAELGMDLAEGGTVGELEEVRLGVEGFIRGLRHAPPVLNGVLSRQFSSYAESVAAEQALLLA